MWSNYGKKITNEQFDIRLSEEFPFLNREEDYINSNTSIVFSCKRCGKKYKKKPKDIKKIKCNCLEREDEYKNNIISKDIELLDNYINMRTKVKHRCLKCSNEFISSPKSVLNSLYGCPSCSGKIFSTEKYKSILPNNIKLLSSEYIGSSYIHKHQCIDCGNEFYTKPNYILHMKTNCPFCSSSKGERVISDFLNSLNIKYKREYIIKIGNKNLRFDFYLEDLDIFIEYDGIQHFKPIEIFGGEDYFKNLKENDDLKYNWCEDNNKLLIRIPYYENTLEYLSYIFEPPGANVSFNI